MIDDEIRVVRERIRSAETGLASRLRPDFTAGTPKILGRVYNAGAIPSTLPGQFAVRVIASIGGAESAAGSPSFEDGTGTAVFTVVGKQVPIAGDILRGRLIGGRWVAERMESGPTYHCSDGYFPRVLTYTGSVSQAQAVHYFDQVSVAQPEPVYTLTYQSRPADIPQQLRTEYYNNPGGVFPPYYTKVADYAWFSEKIPVLLEGSPTFCYFYLWMHACYCNVMVIDAPFGSLYYGTPITEGAGNNIKTYQPVVFGDDYITMPPGADWAYHAYPYDHTARLWGTHGDDDIIYDNTGSSGAPGPVTGS